jgi:uncharacterized protein
MNYKQLIILKQTQYKGLFQKHTAAHGKNASAKALIEERNGKKVYTITVKFSDYTSIDNSRDKMGAGAFNSSFERAKTSNRKVAFLWQHDRKDPIGRIVDFWEDEEGAYVKVELSDFDSVPNAKRAWAQIQDEVINQASFGYSYVWDAVKYIRAEKDDEEGYFLVGEVELYEVSLVTLGDNENTEVVDMEDAEKALIKSFLEKENVLNALIALKDEDVKSFLKEQGIEIKEAPAKGLFGR